MKFFDGVGQITATTGTMTLGAVLGTGFFTFTEQGAADGDLVYYRIDEGGDVEIGIGTLGAALSTLARTTVLKSRIAGTAGTTKMTLAGAAQVRCVAVSQAFNTNFAPAAQATLWGRAAAAGTGDRQDLTAAQARTILNVADGATANAVASQADQETGTDTTKHVTPGTQKFHPSAAKAWGYIKYASGVPSLAAGYGISSLTDSGVGDLSITLTTAFSSANWAPVISNAIAAAVCVDQTAQQTATTVRIICNTLAAASTDPSSYQFAGFGDQ